MLERQVELFDKAPRQVAADGGYASGANLEAVKELGVKDMAFNKKRGLNIVDMAKSMWVYRQLKNFRAGIESNISCLKRAFGLTRCNWKGFQHFQSFVWSSVVSYNLTVIECIKGNFTCRGIRRHGVEASFRRSDDGSPSNYNGPVGSA